MGVQASEKVGINKTKNALGKYLEKVILGNRMRRIPVSEVSGMEESRKEIKKTLHEN